MTDRSVSLQVGHERTIRHGPKPQGGWVRDGIITDKAPTRVIVTLGSPELPPPNPEPTSVSGEPMPTGDLPGWTYIFGDDFTTPVAADQFGIANRDKWGAYPEPWKDSQGKGSYSPKNASIHDGVLDVHMRYENGLYKVCAPVPHINGAGTNDHRLWGRYAARFRVPTPIPGYKLAWLLWPQSNVWPRDGEMDFPDQDLIAGRTIHAFMHRMNGTSGGDQDAYSTNVPIVGDWHTVVMEWKPNFCRFILDGVVIGTSTSRVPNTVMRWVIQCETQLGIPISSIPQSSNGHVLLDWVAAWKPA